MIQYAGLAFLGLLTLNAWAWLSVLQSNARLTAKALWTVILLIPLLGWIVWFLLGPRRA